MDLVGIGSRRNKGRASVVIRKIRRPRGGSRPRYSPSLEAFRPTYLSLGCVKINSEVGKLPQESLISFEGGPHHPRDALHPANAGPTRIGLGYAMCSERGSKSRAGPVSIGTLLAVQTETPLKQSCSGVLFQRLYILWESGVKRCETLQLTRTLPHLQEPAGRGCPRPVSSIFR